MAEAANPGTALIDIGSGYIKAGVAFPNESQLDKTLATETENATPIANGFIRDWDKLEELLG